MPLNKTQVTRMITKCNETFIQGKLINDLGLSLVQAKAVIEIIFDLILTWYGRKRSPHQISRSVVSATEKAGKPIKYCEMVLVNLTVDHPGDSKLLFKSGAVMARQVKCFRLAWEAYDQGGVLTVDDLATLLTVDPSTVKAYVRSLEKLGLFVPTRGRIQDIGRIPSHKKMICTLLAQGYAYTDIARMTGHSESSIERYALTFGKVIFLADQGTHQDMIRLITAMSKQDVTLFLNLYQRFNDTHHRDQLDLLKRKFELTGEDVLTSLPRETTTTRRKKRCRQERTLQTTIRQYLQEALGVTPKIGSMAAHEILEIVDTAMPDQKRLLPGQTVVFADAREPALKSGDFVQDRKVIPITLSIHTPDIKTIRETDLPPWHKIATIAEKLGQQALDQGAILPTAQVAELLFMSPPSLNSSLSKYREKVIFSELPFKGDQEDYGRTKTHKQEIILLEEHGFTPPEISSITNHTPQSRDRYLNTFHRIKAFARAIKKIPEPKQVSKMIGCHKSVAKQYLKIIEKVLKQHETQLCPQQE